jgi:hypothetical protein
VISIKNPIDEEPVLDSFGSAHRDDLQRIQEEGGGFYAWGAVPGVRNIPNWKAMERGDYVLCVYGNTYHYVARVLATYNNERFARRVWGEDEGGETWEYMYFLTEPLEVDRHVSEFEGYLNAVYRGFTRISDEQLDAILGDYGSVDRFIAEMLGRESGDLPPQLSIPLERSQERVSRHLRFYEDYSRE